MTEIWMAVVGWEGFYEVSDLGRVRSVDRSVVDPNGRVQRFKGRVLAPSRTTGGYCQVMFSRGGKHINVSIHRLVLLAFVGDPPVGMVGCHRDGNQTANNLANLKWDTQANNLMDKIAHGTDQRGERNAQVILTDEKILEIRERLSKGVRGVGRQLAREYGVSVSTISAINVGKRWSWLSKEG